MTISHQLPRLFLISILFSMLAACYSDGITGNPINISDDYGNDQASAKAIALDSTTSGVIETMQDLDYFKITLTNAGTLTLTSTGAFDIIGTLEDSKTKPNGFIAIKDNDSGAGLNFKITKHLSPGEYFLKLDSELLIRAYYDLVVSFQIDDYGSTRADPSEIFSNSTTNGKLERSDDVDYFKINLFVGTLTLTNTGKSDVTKILENASGTALTPSVVGDTSTFDIAAAGSYYLKVTSSTITDYAFILSFTRPTTVTGLPLLIVRMEFNNMTFRSDATTWHNKIFGATEGQLNHYFDEVSGTTFQLSPAVETDGNKDGIVTAKLDINHPGNSTTVEGAKEFLRLLVTALQKIDGTIDFSQYDKDKNGGISKDELQIMFLVAGGEAAAGDNPSTSVWAHAWAFDPSTVSAPTLDNVRLMNFSDGGGYSRFGERHGTHDATIGVIAHELGHAAFALPDLYDTDLSSEGIGDFGLMGGGGWGYKSGDIYSGQTPVHPLGWTKIKLGWNSPSVITTNNTYVAHEFKSSTYEIFKINSGKPQEYFLIENRNNIGYDRGLYALEGTGNFPGGLLITHINDNMTTNSIDNDRWVDVVEARNAGLDLKRGSDNQAHSGHYTNLFYEGNSTQLTPTSTPNSARNDGKSSGVSITGIKPPGASMSFDVQLQSQP